jgi:poly-gamma-glutamate synthesis protein (capsule biosynthesis protein)
VRAGPLRVGIAAFTDTEPGWAAGPGSAREGVDLIHGHSAHIFQGIEVHRGKPILYDTGDALDDYAVDPVLRNDRSFVFLADVEGSRVRALRLLPILLQGTRAGLAAAGTSRKPAGACRCSRRRRARGPGPHHTG